MLAVEHKALIPINNSSGNYKGSRTARALMTQPEQTSLR
jgi:hypothetical protein